MKAAITLNLRRGGPGETPAFEAFRAEIDERTTVLDALETLRAGAIPGLLYRHSCHHGSCGTCGCIVNGVERLACTTVLAELNSDEIEVEPLRSAKVLRDLAVFPDRLFRALPEDARYLRTDGAGKERFEDCIECGNCQSACPVRKPFLGPAALAAWSRESVNRSERSKEVLKAVGGPDGAAACERHVLCSLVCPTGVAPAKHIMLLRGKLGR